MSHSKRIKNSYVIVIFFILFLNIFIAGEIIYQYSNHSQNSPLISKKEEIQENPKTSAKVTFTNLSWLKNGNFSSPSVNPWFNTSQGDSSDIIASNSTGQADILVQGDTGIMEISNVFTDTLKWTRYEKTDVDTLPDNYGIDPNGVYCNRTFDEQFSQENQFPRIFWRYNASMNIDMSDYEITSASIEVGMNASVNRDVDVPGDNTARYFPPNDQAIASFELYDSIYYTVEVSDMNVSQENTFLIGFYLVR